ncbi:MAG: LysR family transcriptional regulator [Rhizobiales bacterium]|nr:LysR family transcriptional regulator [Hyphomicrobiales bacterium]
MRPTLVQIEAFYWIARLGGFHAAAARLNISQPTVTLRIRALEQALGVILFEKVGRLSRLTPNGRLLLPHAERMVGLADEIQSRSPLRDPLGGELRLGAPDSFGLVGLPHLLAAIRSAYPALRVALTIDNSNVLGEKLNERELDFAILAEPQVGGHIARESFGTIEVGWVASKHLPIPDRIIRPTDLVGFEVFTNPEPSNLLTLLRQWFASEHIDAPKISTCNSLSVILGLTRAGAGVSLLPTAIVPRHPRSAFRVLRAQPQVGRPRMYGAYQLEKAGAVTAAIMEMTRSIFVRSDWTLKG